MKAHYFEGRVNGKQVKRLILSQGPRPEGAAIIVKGKAEARKLAKQHNAEPWNF